MKVEIELEMLEDLVSCLLYLEQGFWDDSLNNIYDEGRRLIDLARGEANV